MRGVRSVCAVLLTCAACGRIGFDASGDGGALDIAMTDARDMPSDLVVWLPFDDDLADGGADVFGLGYATGAQAMCDQECPTTTAGIHGTAALFGDGLFYRLPDTTNLRLDTGTIAVWIQPVEAPVVPANFQIVGKPYGPTTNDSYELFLESGIRTFIGGDSDTGGPYTGGTYTPALNTWAHLAATWDTTTARVYVNGIEIANDFAFTKLYDTHDVLIGADADGGPAFNFVHGAIDDLRIYNRALSAAEITALATP
ncbi:MAG TPA: LamG domain-containing protein [Kofleriaceae bacterium]|jgi:hypothetical protein